MHTVKYRDAQITIKAGDLTREDADAIVNPANSMMTMDGGVAASIKRVGGEEIEREALARAPVPVGKAVSTTAGRLRAHCIIHAPTMAEPAMRTDRAAVRGATAAALTLAREMRLRSIAFPGMGTGVGAVDPESAALAMAEAIRENLDEGTTLIDIRLIARDDALYRAFVGAVTDVLSRRGDVGPSRKR